MTEAADSLERQLGRGQLFGGDLLSVLTLVPML
jgi:hypothetical protein